MYNITVGRFADDPIAQGVVRPADDFRVKLEAHAEDDPTTGLLCVEDLMLGAFGGDLTREEQDAAHAEYLASREKSPIHCPR